MNTNQKELFEAVEHGNLEDVRRILLCNPQLVLSQDGYGNQPMHIAVMKDNINMVQLLIEFDSPIGRRNFDGLTVKGVARMFNNRRMVSLIDSHYLVDDFRCGKDPEKHYYLRTNLVSIPSQMILREEAKKLKIMKELHEWKNFERTCCIRRIQKQCRKFIEKRERKRCKSASIIQTTWRKRLREKIHMKHQRAAILLQSVERMRVVYMKYTYFDRERLLFYRNTRILASILQRLWRGHKGRSKVRRLMEIMTLPDPSVSRNFEFWLDIQTNSNPPVRSFGVWVENVLSGCPRSWKERNEVKRNGHYRDVKFYTNTITRRVMWEQPDQWRRSDYESLCHRLLINELGFTMEQNKTASMLQSLWRAKVSRKSLKTLLTANRIMSKAREEYETNPKSMSALVNFTLYSQANLLGDENIESLYDVCLKRMMKRGGDNSIILFGYAIFCAKRGDIEYDGYLMRARVAEKREMKRRSSLHPFGLAGTYFRYVANSLQSFEALQNHCLTRLLVYRDIEGSKRSLHEAIRVCRSNEAISNLIANFSRQGIEKLEQI